MSRVIPLKPARAAQPVAAGAPSAASSEAPAFTVSPPLSLYIHFPWCVRKCPYCDFNSHTVRDGIPEAAYIDALIADLESSLPDIWGRRVQTIFFGGGTPSLMTPEALDRLLTAVRARVNLSPEAEITLEANPGTVEADRFKGFRDAGVNRLSIGVQSFDDRQLAALGRIHDTREARRAIELALRTFERVNIDLMYALPQQTLAEALTDLDTAIATGVSHLSCYHLTLEPNTPFAAQPPELPDDDVSADMQEAIEARLAGAGFVHYETSAFAKPGQQCLHNMNYWQFGDYLGIGAGAHGKLSFHDRVRRDMRHKHPNAYLEGAARGDFVQDMRAVGVDELPFEFMMNAARLNDGFHIDLFARHTGLTLDRLMPRLLEAREAGLLELDSGRVKPTLQGRRFLNELLQRFLD
ncbi:Putative oxygen-independent coproporphyrinogen III oxidase [Methyloversatilis universalis FAM5]|uniref:Heme chaperone HemW n=1 Tax=Methyloversatilis universalis (strain ATCC BAA-1314 / DSM 25237 / JCM 13912 / CCUG 52030 / FAM5) TaxID=1000565 RepID=F5RCB5_METUF|nr:radical SAM family heme chaperone HemW [Methyloversatilis universalis]EGK71695.1 Putative oxygen-independent coproporphyrinogen III oxidase [Methyloversatilis universalis FAM5]